MEAAADHPLRAQTVGLAQHHGEDGNGEIGAHDIEPAAVAHERGALGLGAHHVARRIAERQHRDVEGIAQLQEARGLVGGIGVDRAPQHHRIVREQAQRPSFDANKRCDHVGAEVAPQFQNRTLVRDQIDHPAHVVHAQPILRYHLTQLALIGARPLLDRALKIGEVLLGDPHRFGFIGHDDVDHAVAALNGGGTDFIRMEHAQSAAFDHGGAAHAQRGLLGGDDDIATTRHHRVSGKASSRHDAHQGNQSAQLGQQREGFDVQPCRR